MIADERLAEGDSTKQLTLGRQLIPPTRDWGTILWGGAESGELVGMPMLTAERSRPHAAGYIKKSRWAILLLTTYCLLLFS